MYIKKGLKEEQELVEIVYDHNLPMHINKKPFNNEEAAAIYAYLLNVDVHMLDFLFK